jgi:hypothetical protein
MRENKISKGKNTPRIIQKFWSETNLFLKTFASMVLFTRKNLLMDVPRNLMRKFRSKNNNLFLVLSKMLTRLTLATTKLLGDIQEDLQNTFTSSNESKIQ